MQKIKVVQQTNCPSYEREVNRLMGDGFILSSSNIISVDKLNNQHIVYCAVLVLESDKDCHSGSR